MADSGGHWLNLAEVAKLTQDELLAGVVDIAPKRGGFLEEFPMRQVHSPNILWNRSNARRTASRLTIGAPLTWSDNVSYSQITIALAQFYDQTPLNKFVRDTYGTINNYEAQQLMEIKTGMIETINDALVYDDVDYDATHMRGFHHWAVDNTGSDGDIDEGEGVLELMNVRKVITAGIHGIDFMAMNFSLANYIDAYYQDTGPADYAGTMGRIVWTPQQLGLPTPIWGGIPIKRSDYMVAEQANTGVGSDARAKHSSGDEQYSILFFKRGMSTQAMVDPGCIVHFGGNGTEQRSEGQIFKGEYFDKLEGYDAAGIRMTAYLTLGVGAPKSLMRIYDIELGVPVGIG